MLTRSQRASLRGAAARLEPADRALLELSLRRGVDDESLASLLGADEAAVARRRTGVLEEVATRAGVEAAPPAVAEALREDEAPTPRRSSRRARVAGVALAAGGVAAALALSSGGDDAPPPGERTSARGPAARVVELEPVAGGEGRATLRSEEGRLVLEAADLEPGDRYEAWLYDSVTHAASLGDFRGPSARVTGRLREGYRFVDVSREPADGNANHSGASVLRAALP